MLGLFCHASGIISITASASERPPPRTSSSSTASNAPESDKPPSMVKPSAFWVSFETPSFVVTSTSPSRARIQLALPFSVLISPLCPIMCNGCARSHDGKVFVEKRLCTSER